MKTLFLLLSLIFSAHSIAANTKVPYGMITGGPSFFGSLKYAGTTACTWTLTSTSFANFAADTDCPTATVTGSVVAPGTKIPGFVIPANSRTGNYQIIVKSQFYAGNGGINAGWRMSDGTVHTNKAGHYGSGGIQYSQGSLTFNYPYTSTGSATTVQLQAASSTGTMTASAGDSVYLEFTIEVYFFP